MYIPNWVLIVIESGLIIWSIWILFKMLVKKYIKG